MKIRLKTKINLLILYQRIGKIFSNYPYNVLIIIMLAETRVLLRHRPLPRFNKTTGPVLPANCCLRHLIVGSGGFQS